MSVDVLSLMRIFIAVADTGNLTKAGQLLGLSVSAVSHALKRLETYLDTLLIFRDSRSLELTEAGRRYLDYARDISAAESDSQAILKQDRQILQGRLTIGMTMAFGYKIVIPAIHSFMSTYPDIKIELCMDDRHAHLGRAGIDLAIRIGPQKDESLIHRLIGYLPVIYVASPSYIQTHGRPSSINALDNHHIIDHRFADSGRTFPHLRNVGGGDAPSDLDARIICSSDLALEQAAMAGLGIAPLLKLSVINELAQGSLERVLETQAALSPPLWIVYPRRTVGNARARAFIRFIEDEIMARAGDALRRVEAGQSPGIGTALLPMIA